MTLLERLTNDYKEAMKERNETKKTVLNLVLAKIKNKKIDPERSGRCRCRRYPQKGNQGNP